MRTDPPSRFLSCKAQVAGRRESFPLRAANKFTAAAKAAQISGEVDALGWPPALTEHKPATEHPERTAGLGTLLTAPSTAIPFSARSAKAAPAPLKPLPVPRLKPISAEKLIAFEQRYGPRPGAPPVATLIRLRRGTAP